MKNQKNWGNWRKYHQQFFHLLGWEGALSNQPLVCKKPIKHAHKNSKTGKRGSHGIDYLYCYKSPLEGSTAESAIISVKHSENPYENNPKKTFKSHAEDLVYTLECYKHSELKKQQHELLGRTTKSRDSGILFWLSSNDSTYDDLVSKIANSKLDSEWNFESFHVVDNRRIQYGLKNTDSKAIAEFNNELEEIAEFVKNNEFPKSPDIKYQKKDRPKKPKQLATKETFTELDI